MIKTLAEYQQLASRTCPDLGSDKLNLAHMVMGMTSEVSEVGDARRKGDKINITEEYADIMWYLANYCNLRHYELENIYNSSKVIDRYLYSICELTDLVKKFVAYNKPIDTFKEIYHIGNIVKNLEGEFAGGQLILSFERALSNNIDKLKVRYPEKFSDELAVNRNLTEERKQLEK